MKNGRLPMPPCWRTTPSPSPFSSTASCAQPYSCRVISTRNRPSKPRWKTPPYKKRWRGKHPRKSSLYRTGSSMWWVKRLRPAMFAAAVCLPLGLAACGFEPMYGSSSSTAQTSVKASYADVEIANIPNREGQYLRTALIDRLYIQGRPADARYTLEIEPLKRTLTNQAIQKD